MKKAVIMSCLFALFGAGLRAQQLQDFKENEVGFVFSATKFPNTEAGVGGRFLHNYSSNFGFEFAGTFYPVNSTFRLHQELTNGVTGSANVYTGTFNLKGTYRMERRQKVNFFGIVGPGFFVTDPNPGKADWRFALVAGGGAEVIPHPNVAVRADFADLIVFVNSDRTNNFDFKLSLMYRW
ncbi:MAG TPA: outer membrane beta-barrel protein [Acidobacteriota bacterium]|nr:outer membrane beta-barrel protein [Acidobacteriota bacterium]